MKLKSLPLKVAASLARRTTPAAFGVTGRGRLQHHGSSASGIASDAKNNFPGVMVARESADNFCKGTAAAMAFATGDRGLSYLSIVPNLNNTPPLTGINFSAGWPGKGFARTHSRSSADATPRRLCSKKISG